ncbi:mannitol-1-phosphate 5-dehydrogenase [Escherichia coli]|nr:mannitol-1-phosphate 5-dehydrogenase [Escherichia coli]
MPDATLSRLIVPTNSPNRRPDKAFTPHPASGETRSNTVASDPAYK